MPSYTRYLATTKEAVLRFAVNLFESQPATFLENAIKDGSEIRYSPVMPAFLTLGEGPPEIPTSLYSISFFFVNSPYKGLGVLKPEMSANERNHVYFSEGLASIVCFNIDVGRAKSIRAILSDCPLEFWPIHEGVISVNDILTEVSTTAKNVDLAFPQSQPPELGVYLEQIYASLSSLRSSYEIYFPTELETLRQVTIHVENLVRQFIELKGESGGSIDDLARLKDANAIKAALVEASAALSYAVTQGTSGSLPILSNRSPFPHHSLLGIGGAVRALTRFTRHIEWAFMARSAGRVIASEYPKLEHIVPGRISEYSSGPQYKFHAKDDSQQECFDLGPDLPQSDQIPLISHFSLRHGFMESKYSVTAASEALSAETSPQWTLMTLSHEIMHSRVRAIFQALFGKTWNENEGQVITKHQFEDFAKWFQSRNAPKEVRIDAGLRNVILYFCYALEKYHKPVDETDQSDSRLYFAQLSELYCRHKHLAIELVVHFHDYYFVYAYQPKLYISSLWASWINVAGPYARPLEYLVRSMSTVACGTGLKPDAAFVYAKDLLLDGLLSLEAIGIVSPLFGELRRLLSSPTEGITRAYFDPCYYLMDTVRRYFASRTIAAKFDQLATDQFAEGSISVDDYAANIYVFGESGTISPIRYSLATLFKTLSGESPINDPQWLTAWDYMVLSS